MWLFTAVEEFFEEKKGGSLLVCVWAVTFELTLDVFFSLTLWLVACGR